MSWHKAAMILVTREGVCGRTAVRNTCRRAIRSWFKSSVSAWETLAINVMQIIKTRRKRSILSNWLHTMTINKSNREKAQTTEHSGRTLLAKNILNKKSFHLNIWKKMHNIANSGIKVQNLHTRYLERKSFSLWIDALADFRINLKVHQVQVMWSMRRSLANWRKKV